MKASQETGPKQGTIRVIGMRNLGGRLLPELMAPLLPLLHPASQPLNSSTAII